MPWFAVDDGFDTHPKVRKAGNAAAGLFVRLGAHSAKHLTEGRLDGGVVDDYGTPATIRKLVAVGMLHAAQHGCARCPQPGAGDFVIHDFLDYNKSRRQVESARDAGRKRQQKGREKSRETRNSPDSDEKIASKSRENDANLGKKSRENEPQFGAPAAGQGDVSHRYTLEGESGVPSHPIPSPPSPEVKEGKTARYARADSPIDERPRIPVAALPLVEALSHHGMTVGWDLRDNEWFLVEVLIKRCGIDHLVTSARGSWQGARTQPRSGRYFIPAWRALPDTPAEPADDRSGSVVPFRSPALSRPSTTDARVQDALDLGRQMQEEADAAAKEAAQ